MLELTPPEILGEIKRRKINLWHDHTILEEPDHAINIGMSLRRRGATIVSGHPLGGVQMLQALKQTGLTVYATTELGLTNNRSGRDQVLMLANTAIEARVDGIVCAPEYLDSVLALPNVPVVICRMEGTPTPYNYTGVKWIIGESVYKSEDAAQMYRDVLAASTHVPA